MATSRKRTPEHMAIFNTEASLTYHCKQVFRLLLLREVWEKIVSMSHLEASLLILLLQIRVNDEVKQRSRGGGLGALLSEESCHVSAVHPEKIHRTWVVILHGLFEKHCKDNGHEDHGRQ